MQDISLEQAISVLLEHTKKIEAVEEVPLLEALGRILAEDAVATFDNPPFDRSPLDGYAFAASGTKGAQKEVPASFRIIGEECAGDFFTQEVPEGAAVRLMTGAAIPKGCDCVVRQEDVTVQDECILVPYELHHHENYCFAGEDVRKGTLAVKRGTELTAAHLGVLASLGLGTVKVRRRPRIAIASTGDELVLPGEPLRPGKIYNSNLYVLAGRLQELGFEPEVLGILPDDAAKAASFIAGWREKVDLFLTTGGVSVGKKDIMHEVVRRIGAHFPLEPVDPNYTGEVAERWRYTDGGGEIGVISSVTQAFCSSCTRARLSTEGSLYTCLFAQQGHDLRSLLRQGCSDAELSAVIGELWRQRDDRYSEIRTAETAALRKIEMSYIDRKSVV